MQPSRIRLLISWQNQKRQRFLRTQRRTIMINGVGNGTVSDFSTETSVLPNKTAAIIVIGDEILKGYTVDTNSGYLCKQLFKHHVIVQRITVLPDKVDTIAQQVLVYSNQFDHVITSGGVGPTHDDVTYEGVARAFNVECKVNDQLAAVVRQYFTKIHDAEKVNDPHGGFMKLAKIPSTSRLLWGIDSRTGERGLYPVVRVKNVTILPGIPHLLRKAFDMNLHEFTGRVSSNDRSPEINGSAIATRDEASSSRRTYRVYSKKDEFHISDVMNRLAAHHPEVNIGSYPDLKHSYYRVQITIDSAVSDSAAMAVRDELVTELGDAVVDFDEEPQEGCVEKLERFTVKSTETNAAFGKLLVETRSLIEQAFTKFGAHKLAVSFNGGKDCMALLHLVYVVFRRLQSEGVIAPDAQLQIMYIRPARIFPQLERFIDDTIQRYNLRLLTGGDGHSSMKVAIQQIMDHNPDILAVFLGGRYGDPGHSGLQPMQYTDPGWPQIMRVHAMLPWSYSNVWRLIRGLWIPYCSLYDRGYTSLGCIETTAPNEALAYVDGLGIKRYRPAYELTDESLERAGRIKRKSKSPDQVEEVDKKSRL